MFSIYKKELSHYFSSLIAYIVLGIFFLFMGLVLWVFPQTSIIDNNYANMNAFFGMAPTIFTFVIPAITMHSFSEERQSGTIEMLLTKPIRSWQILGGKYLASLTLILFALIPTLIYYFTVYRLGLPEGNIDSGAIIGSYIGLFLLVTSFVAIGIYASTLTSSQVIAFVIATFLCFFIHWGLDYLGQRREFLGISDDILQRLGMNHHYLALSRGLLDSRNVLYFISISSLFLILSNYSLNKSRK